MIKTLYQLKNDIVRKCKETNNKELICKVFDLDNKELKYILTEK